MSCILSIIVPVYNVERYVGDCIELILQNKSENLEIIVIDDGSTDQSKEICDNYTKIDNRIKVVHTENSGLAVARNLGLKLARGKYICFVDSDDIIEPILIDEVMNHIKNYNSDIIVFGKRYLYKNTSKLEKFCKKEMRQIAANQFYRLIFSQNEWAGNFLAGGYVWSKVYRKDVIGDVRFIESYKYNEDELFNIEVCGRAKKIGIINKVLYNYRQRATSLIYKNNFDLRLLRGRVLIYKKNTNTDFEGILKLAIVRSILSCTKKWSMLSNDDRRYVKECARKYTVAHLDVKVNDNARLFLLINNFDQVLLLLNKIRNAFLTKKQERVELFD